MSNMGCRILYVLPDVDQEMLMTTSTVRILYTVREDGDARPDPTLQAEWNTGTKFVDAQRVTNQVVPLVASTPVGRATLSEFLQEDGVSMWQFMLSYVYPKLMRAVDYIEKLDPLLSELRPDRVVGFFSHGALDHRIWCGALEAVAEKHGVPSALMPIEADSPGKRIGRALHYLRVNRPGWTTFWGLISLVLMMLGGPIARTMRPLRRNGKLVLFTSYARYWTRLADGSWTDEQFSSILRELRTQGLDCFLGLDTPYTLDVHTLRSFITRLWKDPTVAWRSFMGYVDYAPWKRRKFNQRWWSAWTRLRRDVVFLEKFTHLGVRLMPSLEAELEKIFRFDMPFCSLVRQGARTILDSEQPDLVVLTYEQGPYQRALIIEAAVRQIPSIALQHGSISADHYDYVHDKVTLDARAEPNSFAIPTVTCVFGETTKKVLTDIGRYPPEAVAVTGNWKHDDVVHYRDRTDPRLLARSFGLDPDLPVIGVLTADQASPEMIRVVLETAARRTRTAVRVKLHPCESVLNARTLLDQLHHPQETLVEGRLKDVIMVSTIVICQVSTTILETILFDKPVIVVNARRLSIAEEYKAGAFCLYVEDLAELPGKINLLLDDAASRASLAAARPAFVARELFAADGNSSRRVAEVIAAAQCCSSDRNQIKG
jgi:hypothetical protein